MSLALIAFFCCGCHRARIVPTKNAPQFTRKILGPGVILCDVPNRESATETIQACLDRVPPEGGTVTLDPGTYIIGPPGLKLTHGKVTLTSSVGDCIATECPVLKARRDLEHPLLKRLPGVNDFTITSLVFDGNRSARTNHGLCDVGARQGGSNIVLTEGAHDFHVLNITSRDTLCGSALSIQGYNFEVGNSIFIDNGYPRRGRNKDRNPWSDGITLANCNRDNPHPSYRVHDNQIIDSTDVGLVVGGGARGKGTLGCIVENNTIIQKTARAFAGLAIHNFPGNGNGVHINSEFRNNKIDGGPRHLLDFGISVGFHAWDSRFGERYKTDLTNAAVVHNRVQNAAVNLEVDGVCGGVIADNDLSNPGGRLERFPRCPSYSYTAVDWFGISLQEGYVPVFYHSSPGGPPECGVSTPWTECPTRQLRR